MLAIVTALGLERTFCVALQCDAEFNGKTKCIQSQWKSTNAQIQSMFSTAHLLRDVLTHEQKVDMF